MLAAVTPRSSDRSRRVGYAVQDEAACCVQTSMDFCKRHMKEEHGMHDAPMSEGDLDQAMFVEHLGLPVPQNEARCAALLRCRLAALLACTAHARCRVCVQRAAPFGAPF